MEEINFVQANKTSNSNRLIIGSFIQSYTSSGGFQEALLDGMIKSAKIHDVNLFIFAGGSIDHAPYNPYEKHLNFIYNLIDKERINGLIIPYTMGNFITSERFAQFCQQFSPIPMVGIVGNIKDLPNVQINNKQGMQEIIDHLINHHKFRKLAFIKGIEGNFDAEERFNVYKEVLKKNRIDYDPDLVYQGDFQVPSGINAINFFIKQKNKVFDAVIASNDAMAFGAISELRKIGKKIPFDIAVTGFDDTNESSAFNPSLTTAKQPFDEMCAKAIEILQNIIRGKKNTELTSTVPSRLVIRQSCGCYSQDVIQSIFFDNNELSRTVNNEDEKSETVINETIKELDISSDNTRCPECIKLIKCFLSDIHNDSSNEFLLNLKQTLYDEIIDEQKIFSWQGFISIFRKNLLLIYKDNKIIGKIENFFHQARILISEMAYQRLKSKKLNNKKQSQMLIKVGQMLITSFDFDKLKKVIREQLPALNIPSCFISIFENPDTENLKPKIFIAFNEKGDIDLIKDYKDEKFSLPDKKLLPQNKRFTFAVHPLCFLDKKLGYIFFELGPEDGLLYDTLQVQISSSLMGSELFLKREKTESILKQRSDNIQELVRPMLNSISEVTKLVKEKTDVINNLMNLTKENNQKLNSTNKSISEMEKKIYEMLDMINIIDDISIKVDILALNASIEASHAGQYGKGFSVIANEIRKLSNSTKKNTVEISNLLKNIRITIDNSSKAGNDSFETFKKLEKDVFELATALQEISKSMDILSKSSSEILSIMNV